MKGWRWIVVPSLFVFVAMVVLPKVFAWYEDYINPTPGHWRTKATQATSPEKAVEYFSRAIDQDPDDHEAHWRRGMSLAALGRLDEAIADVTAASRMATKHEYLQNLDYLEQVRADQKKAESRTIR